MGECAAHQGVACTGFGAEKHRDGEERSVRGSFARCERVSDGIHFQESQPGLERGSRVRFVERRHGGHVGISSLRLRCDPDTPVYG